MTKLPNAERLNQRCKCNSSSKIVSINWDILCKAAKKCKEASPTTMDCSLYSHRATFMMRASQISYKIIPIQSVCQFYAIMIIPTDRDPRNPANKYRILPNKFMELLCFSESH